MIALGLCLLDTPYRIEASLPALLGRVGIVSWAVRNPALEARLPFKREDLPHMSCFSLQRNDYYFLRTQHRSSTGRAVCEGARRWPHVLGSCPNHHRMGSQGGICGCACSHGEQRTHRVRGQVERLEKGFFPSLSERCICKPCVRSDASQHCSSSTTTARRIRIPGHRALLNQQRKNSNSYSCVSTTGVVKLGAAQSQRTFRRGNA